MKLLCVETIDYPTRTVTLTGPDGVLLRQTIHTPEVLPAHPQAVRVTTRLQLTPEEIEARYPRS